MKSRVKARIELGTLQKKHDTLKKQFAKLVNSIDSEVVGDQRSAVAWKLSGLLPGTTESEDTPQTK